MTGKEGYFLAKREVQDSLDGRIEVLKEKISTADSVADTALMAIEIQILEKTRSHLRNSLLWNSKND